MGRFKKVDDPNQAFLLPPSITDWLPKEHLAWFINDAVDELDVDEILDSYRISGKGELPYEPRMMLKVLIYGYCTSVFSSRKIAKQLEDSVAFRVLAKNQTPGHRTICRFRETHIEEFEELFVRSSRWRYRRVSRSWGHSPSTVARSKRTRASTGDELRPNGVRGEAPAQGDQGPDQAGVRRGCCRGHRVRA